MKQTLNSTPTVFPEFISRDEQAELIEFANRVSGHMLPKHNSGGKGLRRSDHVCELPNPPACMDWIERRIRLEFGLTNRVHPPRLVVHEPGAETTPHDDGKAAEWHLKTNLMLQCADGGQFRWRDEPVEWSERELLTFKANHQHEVTPVTGGKRIIIHIGWSINPERVTNADQ